MSWRWAETVKLCEWQNLSEGLEWWLGGQLLDMKAWGHKFKPQGPTLKNLALFGAPITQRLWDGCVYEHTHTKENKMDKNLQEEGSLILMQI